MTPYKSKSGKQSGVTAYEIGSDFITVWFGSKSYKYTESLNSHSIIEYMKSCANSSIGLSTYIAQNKTSLKYI